MLKLNKVQDLCAIIHSIFAHKISCASSKDMHTLLQKTSCNAYAPSLFTWLHQALENLVYIT